MPTVVTSYEFFRFVLPDDAVTDLAPGEKQIDLSTVPTGAALAAVQADATTAISDAAAAQGDATQAIADAGAAQTVAQAAAVSASTYSLTAYVKNIISANGVVAYVTIPQGGGGDITDMRVVADAETAVGSVTFTSKISNSAITGGVLTILASTSAGIPAVATPSAANTVSEGDVVSFLVGGSNTAAGSATITITVTRPIAP